MSHATKPETEEARARRVARDLARRLFHTTQRLLKGEMSKVDALTELTIANFTIQSWELEEAEEQAHDS